MLPPASGAGAPLIVGDKLYFYLSGRRLRGTQEITTTGLAMLRRDGFASMKGTGELQTSLLKFDGSYFFVNANVTGEMKVEQVVFLLLHKIALKKLLTKEARMFKC